MDGSQLANLSPPYISGKITICTQLLSISFLYHNSAVSQLLYHTCIVMCLMKYKTIDNKRLEVESGQSMKNIQICTLFLLF